MPPELNKKDSSAAIVVESMVGGGVERMCIEISKCLLHANYEVDLILLDFKGELLKQIPNGVNLHGISVSNHISDDFTKHPTQVGKINWVESGLNGLIRYRDFFRHVLPNWPFGFRRVPHRRDRLVRYANGFATYLSQNNPDFIFAMQCRVSFTTLIGREISGSQIPVICSVHNSLTSTTRHRIQIYTGLLHKADWVHAVSAGIKRELSERKLFPAQRTTAIYNFFDDSRITQLVGLRSGHPWLDRKVRLNHKVILAVGRLASQKNHPLLIRSFANIAQSAGNIKLIILGEGRGREDLQSLIVKLGLVHIVSLPGWIANPFPLLCQTDVFVLSSYFEGLPIILIEALACGCNIVSTDCTHGPREILDHGKFGELVPVDDELAMTEAISRSLNSNPNREALVTRAEEFSPKRQIADFEQMFSQVLASHAQ